MCEEYTGFIEDLVEAELADDEARKISLHIIACQSCTTVYEALMQEKEIYSHYLFNVEPSVDITTNFLAKLNSNTIEYQPLTAQNSALMSLGTKILRTFRLILRPDPIFSRAVLIFLFPVFGAACLIFTLLPKNESKIVKKAEQTERINQTSDKKSIEANRDEKNISLVQTKTINFSESLNRRKIVKSEAKKDNPALFVNLKTSAGKKIKLPEKIETKNAKIEARAGVEQEKEETMRRLIAGNLEKETIRQIEKIELLLRSFRNVRSEDGDEFYDVAYEKQQAKKLLEKNVELRLGAESYGTLYAEEVLSKVEPYLLEISNLDNKPLREKVLDIKERVKNQNIIVGLQIYK